MKAVIDKDEWYPVYCLSEVKDSYGFGDTLEIPDELLKRYRLAEKEFHEVQEELKQLLEKYREENN